jgi:hypothetical protein
VEIECASRRMTMQPKSECADFYFFSICPKRPVVEEKKI